MEAINIKQRGHQSPREEQEEFDSEFAFSEGARVGRLGLSPNLNPYHPDDQLFAEWERGRKSALAQSLRSAPAARTREPVFVQKWKDQKPGDPVPLSTLVQANVDDSELCDWARRAPVDACYMTGGGAAPACWLRRVA